jgi:hypothetical protein
LAQFLKGAVERIPDLSGQGGADNAPVFARRGDAGSHGRGVVMIKEQKPLDIALDGITIFLGEGVGIAGCLQERIPFVAISGG